MQQNVITLSTGTDIPNSVYPDQMPQNVITLSTGTDIPNSVYPDQMPQNVITLSTGTDIPNSVYPDQMPQNVITLSTGTDMSFQTVYTQIRCHIIWPLIRVYTVCHTYSNGLDTLRGSRMDYYKYCK